MTFCENLPLTHPPLFGLVFVTFQCVTPCTLVYILVLSDYLVFVLLTLLHLGVRLSVIFVFVVVLLLCQLQLLALIAEITFLLRVIVTYISASTTWTVPSVLGFSHSWMIWSQIFHCKISFVIFISSVVHASGKNVIMLCSCSALNSDSNDAKVDQNCQKIPTLLTRSLLVRWQGPVVTGAGTPKPT